MVLLLSSLATIATGAAPSKKKGNPFFALVPSESTLQDALLELGSPDAIFLEGAEAHKARRTDPIVLRYDKSIPLGRDYPCTLWVNIDPLTYKVRELRMQLGIKPEANLPTATEIETALGKDHDTSHVNWVFSEGETEAHLGTCSDPAGEIEVWIYREMCLEVYFNHKTMRAWLLTSAASTSSKQYAPCK
jgi:hypothetical protein